MNEDEIKGRNLILDGRFSDNWKNHWTHFNGKGNMRVFEDPVYDHYLMMNAEAAITQTFNTATFTSAQMSDATYKLSFQYENHLDGLNAKVVVKTSTGKVEEIDLSGKAPAHPEATWNPYLPLPLEVIAQDQDLTFELHGSDRTDSGGLRITNLDVQLHLAPLKLSRLQVDDRTYEV